MFTFQIRMELITPNDSPPDREPIAVEVKQVCPTRQMVIGLMMKAMLFLTLKSRLISLGKSMPPDSLVRVSTYDLTEKRRLVVPTVQTFTICDCGCGCLKPYRPKVTQLEASLN